MQNKGKLEELVTEIMVKAIEFPTWTIAHSEFIKEKNWKNLKSDPNYSFPIYPKKEKPQSKSKVKPGDDWWIVL